MGKRSRSALLVTIALAVSTLGGCSDDAPSGGGATASRRAADGPDKPELATRAPLPEPRTEVAGIRWRSALVVVGGLRADGSPTTRVDLYDVSADAWDAGPDLPAPLHHTGLAIADGRLWVVGGYSGTAADPWVEQSAVYSLGAGERTWRVEARLPAATGALGVAGVGSTVVAFGGAREGRQVTETWTLAADGDAWEAGPDLRAAREHLAAAAVGDRVFAIGGRVGGLETNLGSVESWKPGDDEWRAEHELLTPRGGIAAAVVHDRLCVAGGEEPEGTIASVECLDADGWRQLVGLRIPRHGLAVMDEGDRLHVVGGGDKPGLFVTDVHEVVAVPRR